MDPSSTTVTYEQPLNERIRIYLKLEHLFKQIANCAAVPTIWSSRSALFGVLDTLNILARHDIKTDILKELERQSKNLSRLESNPEVDTSQLTDILDRLDILIDRLHSLRGQVAQDLRGNELLNSIRQRMTIPGGTCGFDLPGFNFWLKQSDAARTHDLLSWYENFDLVRSAIDIILMLVRRSAQPTSLQAIEGFYQQSLDGRFPQQMIRVTIPSNLQCFPEISGGKHRFTVRFMTGGMNARPTQVQDDINFQLTCCVL
ncbi:MAG: cell division protein ZapD [Gammaproteobacteria bacterium]|nr:MAG: cell division protein ZapD [Gammaproteobacteria bacterium]